MKYIKFSINQIEFWKKSELNKSNFLFLILNFLNENELLIFRFVNTSIWNATKKIIGLYENPKQFALGTSGYFKTIEQFKTSWIAYEKSMACQELVIPYKPALLYKATDLNSAEFIHKDFPQGEDVYENGRIYAAVFPYTWEHNTAWLLGNIHLGRSFLLVSPLVIQSLFRADKLQEYSALSKELVGLYKAGYKATGINAKKHILFSLTSDKVSNQEFNIKDLKLETSEIKTTLKIINQDIEKLSYDHRANEEKCFPHTVNNQGIKFFYLSILKNLMNSTYWENIYRFWFPNTIIIIRKQLDSKEITLRKIKKSIPYCSQNHSFFRNNPINLLNKAIHRYYTFKQLVSSPELQSIFNNHERYIRKMEQREYEANLINSTLPDFV